MTWLAIHVDVLTSYAAHEYQVLLADEEFFKKTCLGTRLFSPLTLTSVLQSHSPPSLDFFRSLNVNASGGKVWGIYILLLEKTDHKPNLYIGSGTSQHGVQHSFRSITNVPLYFLG